MRKSILFILLGILIYSCSSTKKRTMEESPKMVQNDTVRIANDSLEYEIIIIDPGFSYFLNAIARPEGYYSLPYLENKNRILVNDYNYRARNPFAFNEKIYTQPIDYDPNIDYGYEVNYKLYNYFVYLSRKYNQNFSVPARL